MKIRDLIGFNDSRVEPVVVKDNITENITDTINERFKYFEELLKNTVETPAPTSYENSVLNDDESREMLKVLLHLYKSYFNDVPPNRNLDYNFISNIPKDVFKVAMNSYDKNEIPVLNPLIYLYILCVDDIYALPLYVKYLKDLFIEYNDEIDEYYDDYIEYLNNNE